MLSRTQILEEIQYREELMRRKLERKILRYFPDTGPVRRELYPKHLEFFQAGKSHRQRLMLAANRIGKTEGTGGYELVLHLTGWYPAWWPGRKFDRAIRAWAAGDTGKTVREVVQGALLGPPGAWGTGLIPSECIVKIVKSPAMVDTVDSIYVKHTSGANSVVTLKSYEQERKSFQGTAQDIVWLDEEPPLDIYTESLMRTMTSDGMLMLTFTPLMGMSEVVLAFLPNGELKTEDQDANASKYTVMATWDDAPHLSEQVKAELWAELPPHQRDARSKGIPQLGAGAIYPVSENDILVDPFPIPDYWPQGYGMDVGWKATAAVFGAIDRKADVLYLTHGYKRGNAEPSIHVTAIKAPGEWLPGFIDPASRGRSQRDGGQLLADYRALGLNLTLADNGVESGLYEVWNRLSTGRLKVFRTLTGWLQEYRLYRRDEHGKVVKENDHLMDCTRYLVSRLRQMVVKPVPIVRPERNYQAVSVWN